MERSQSQLRAMEARDRALMDANYERVNWWSAIHMVCLVAVATVQVYTVRSLFVDDSKLGKLMRRGRL